MHIVALATSSTLQEKSSSKKKGANKTGKNKESNNSMRVDAEVRSEASWVILNASSCGSDAQIEQLVNYGCENCKYFLCSLTFILLMVNIFDF